MIGNISSLHMIKFFNNCFKKKEMINLNLKLIKYT